MKIKSAFVATFLIITMNPGIAQANERPVVESFSFAPNDLDLISVNTVIEFELVVSHPAGIANLSTLASLTGPYGSVLSTYLTRTDIPVNYSLNKVTFKGNLALPQGVAVGAYSVSISEVKNNSSAGYEYSTGVITPKKLRDLIGAEYSLLVRSNGNLNLSYDTFIGPSHDTTLGISYSNPLLYNNDDPPNWKVGETYLVSKFFELRVPSLTLTVLSLTPNICSTEGKELKLIATGKCAFKVSTAKTKDYLYKESVQNVTISPARIKPELVLDKIPNQTAKDLPKTIEIFKVFSPTNLYVLPKSTSPTVCIANGFYVQIVGGGTCILTYQSEASAAYLASDIYKVSFDITKDLQTIVFAPSATADIATKSLALNATTSSGGQIIYSTTSPEICSINGSILNLLKAGNCNVTATQAGTSTLALVSATASITLTGTAVVAKKTITCIKGKTTKKVTGTNPKCPAGYKLKK